MKKLILAVALLAAFGAHAQADTDMLMCLAATRAHGPSHPLTVRLCGVYVPQPRRSLEPPPQPQQPYYDPRPIVTKCRRNDSTGEVRCVTGQS